MTNNYHIKAGIDKENQESLRALSVYLQAVEGANSSACRQLNEIIENDPRLLFEPKKIDEQTSFPFKDLAFLYHGKEIIGHLFHIFNRETTAVGYKTSITLVEEYFFFDIPNNYYDEYVVNRLKGSLELEFKLNEKSNQK